ncbi:Rgg/GadR/MutR family transcriptional regulator [Streptococcus iniae]|uniref:Transcriptional regulator n=1 Tax=Streptococcus iniae TaxID=1346 RepID=A0A1J0N093_STRIN|nr:Rgg/GadR/MutR family transcriptional regulator [Streptococcus iniae]AGM99228.1 DNA-binding helix-turn-helix protein [Streptococcus iniae SF1]AHY16165.1 transcriptional regulator [Streptococcus iniae]AHY18029.1 transcriptional regulator [Streptococcus iniae]AJG26320.1 transcriptional regulator [Streptococcus iniae]APD32200.1 transcriptional regulator [Streptococcus iniae]
METRLGKTLRSLRKGKQVTISALADEHLSKSQISRFERGESEISCNRLLNLLDKLNISIDEFLSIHSREHTHFFTLLTQLRKYSAEQNREGLVGLLEAYQEKPYETTMIKAVTFSIDQTIKPDESEINQLTDYLFKVEHWGNYEIILLGNCTRFINYNTLFLLTKEMVTSFAYSEQNKSNKVLVTQLSINCLIISIDNHYFENSCYLISKIQELLTNEIQFYEKTIFLYVHGYYKLKQGDIEGKKEMEDALTIFQLLNENALYDAYQEHYYKQVSANAL